MVLLLLSLVSDGGVVVSADGVESLLSLLLFVGMVANINKDCKNVNNRN